MKRFFKWAAGILGGLVVLAVALFVQVWYFRPFSIDLFFERIFIQYALTDPELLTSVGLLEQFGIDGHNRRLSDASPRQTERIEEITRRGLEQLRGYDRDDLDASQRLSYDVLEWFLQDAVNGTRFQYHDYPVNQMFGVQTDTPRFMIQVHRIDDLRGARNYVERLGQFGVKFDGVIESLELRESKGIVPPRFVIARVLGQMRDFRAPKPEEHSLYTHLRDKLNEIGAPEAERRELLERARERIEGVVYPAYDRLIAYFAELQPKVTEDYGVWKLPDGDAYYDWLVSSHTTTRLTAQQVHDFGLAEVARIEQEMDAILKAQGLAEGTIGERIAVLDARPENHYPNDDEGRAQCLADYQRIIDEIDDGLDTYFNARPKQGVKVARMQTFEEGGATGAYYMAPSLDGKRPGTFYVNLRDMREVQKFAMRTLAYHEAIPGHHFQSALAAELTGVPTFRRIIPFTAYDEGWGLYAERLAWELGFEQEPLDNLGRLQAEIYRAVRLVVDTGIHRQHWTREQAIAYMREKTGMAETDVVSEIERYFVMPGQALAYKIGMQRFLELRERARERLGERFRMGEFHDTVLTQGSLPLEVMSKEVDAWIARRLEAQPAKAE